MKAISGIIFIITRGNFSTCITEYTDKRTCIPSHTIETWGEGGGQMYRPTYSQSQQKMEVNGQLHIFSALSQ